MDRLLSCDVGSLPYNQDLDMLMDGAIHFLADSASKSAKVFESSIVASFIDKLNVGVSVPAYPQFRDMNEMFLSSLEGVEKIEGRFVEVGRLLLKSGFDVLPEVEAIKRNRKRIYDQFDCQFSLRVCLTGPYTLASFFPYRTSETYLQLGQILSQIVEKNTFSEKEGRTFLVSIDEPLFGMIDDSSIDRGTEGRETLLKAWETISLKAKTNNVKPCMHLHCTSDDLFWAVDSLEVIESHADDQLYEMKTTEQQLSSTDKFLKASIAVTIFDRLIWGSLGSKADDEAVADIWKRISKKDLDPREFLEDVEVMERRLRKVIDRFGLERVVLAGAECGLKGFPDYGVALECLKRASKAVTDVAQALVL